MTGPVASWFGSQRPTTLLVLRLLLLANAGLLGVIGGLFVAFVSRPGGLAVGGALWLAAAILLALVPHTNVRRPDSRW